MAIFYAWRREVSLTNDLEEHEKTDTIPYDDRLKIEGIYLFGGISSEHEINGTLRVLRPGKRGATLTDAVTIG